MIVKKEGHVYELQNFETSGTQEIKFVKKEPSGLPDSTLKRAGDGTTNEEVLAVLIDRMYHLNSKMPSTKNDVAIKCLEKALAVLNERTADRKNRKVEGTNKA